VAREVKAGGVCSSSAWVEGGKQTGEKQGKPGRRALPGPRGWAGKHLVQIVSGGGLIREDAGSLSPGAGSPQNDTPRHGRATRPGRERCLVVGGKLDLMESLRGLGRGFGPPVPRPVASGYLWFLRRAVGTRGGVLGRSETPWALWRSRVVGRRPARGGSWCGVALFSLCREAGRAPRPNKTGVRSRVPTGA
jgi:hypothetical protein